MLPEMFANELSFDPPAVDVEEGQRRVSQFVMTMRAATAGGILPTLRVEADFFAKPIASGYYWSNWRNDKRVELEVRQFFRSLATKVPFLKDKPDVEATWADIDCLWQGRSAMGLKAAYISEGLAVSLLSRAEWDSHLVTCEICEIVDENVCSRRASIHHASLARHLDAQRDWIHVRIRSAIRDGKDLWLRCGELFPLLVFCPTVENQILGLPVQALGSICRGLFYLNAYCYRWQSGPFHPEEIECDSSTESEATLNKYTAERTFLCPDGRERLFSWHAKLGHWRIHFHPVSGSGHLFIGYVGRHLRTVNFR